jgi:crossover junction endodeoxyribonuclease RuvC
MNRFSQMQKPSKIILGVDPGTLVMGYGIIACQGKSISLVEMSVLKMNSKNNNHERLALIHQKIAILIEQHRPDYFAIEAPFFGKNVQSMLKLGRAQGVAIAAAMQAGLEVYEYSPKKVKQAVTGNGNADKDQVWQMLQRIMQMPGYDLKFLDASDALAVAVCHYYQQQSPLANTSRKASDWKDFLQRNPQRIR